MLYKTKAIVLGGFDIKEADRIVTFYSEQRGKIKAIAKGVRKTRSKFGSSLEPFTLSNLLIYPKTGDVIGGNKTLDIGGVTVVTTEGNAEGAGKSFIEGMLHAFENQFNTEFDRSGN